MITAVVFDLDDTLYDEIDYCRSGFEAVSKVIATLPASPGSQEVFRILWREFMQGNHTRVFDTAVEKLGIAWDDEFVGRLVEKYREHKPAIKLPGESRDVLEQLRGKYKLALLTDGFLPAQRLKVQALEIEQYFQYIVYTEQLGRQFWKPSPAGFKKILEGLDVKAQNCVYVADNEAKDFLAPNKLGLQTIQVIRANRIHTKACAEPGGKALHKIESLRQLPPLLAGS